MKLKKIASSVALVFFLNGQATATDILQYANPAPGNLADPATATSVIGGSYTLIDFSSTTASNTPLTQPFSLGNVSINSPSGNIYIQSLFGSNGVTNGDGGGSGSAQQMKFTFLPALKVNGFAIQFGGADVPLTIKAYNSSNALLGTITTNSNGNLNYHNYGYIGFKLDGIRYFTLDMSSYGPAYDWVLFNNLIYSIFSGPSTADTQQSLVNAASALQNIYTLQNSVLANSFAYDCDVFGANNVCVSAGGRNTAVSAANGLNNTSALLIAAYRPHPNYRIGAYADQNLSVNNAGSTVNLGNNTPLIGLFGAWNERQDGTGTEVKVSAAYGQKNTTITRQVVGTSEAGSGSSQLNSQGAQVVAKYGFGFADQIVVSPYAGVRYTQNNMGGYTEASTSSVTAPLTYSALNTNATTALAGVGVRYKGIAQTTLFASAGIESDTNFNTGTYSATGVTGLTPVNFNPNPVKNRATATLGAYYDIEKNQRLGVTGIYRQEMYQAVGTTTVMATYTVGL
ncbi:MULTISPECIES: autotransporter outer membrane beta-barrel domain-containing protein [Polynucleobacter]|nr:MULTISPECIES: autotransporter outer membrane beta-barrel domain-containing protein [Polynucleobacter]MBU3553014.1 autotransporter outer membrane beta-barrel domain-containing protein [Polynucleobacter sp. MWH-Post4-6-1]